MIKVDTPEGVDEFHGAKVEVTEKGYLLIQQFQAFSVYDPGDWLNIEYQEDNA